jgi:glycosyltransferase involved in cell wall biosynthesis
MRILLATDWNRGRGGAEAHALLLRDGLAAAGDEVRLLTSSAGTAGDGRAEYVAWSSERLAARTLLQIVNPFAVARARQAVRELRPDAALVNMFAHHLSPALLYALGDVPLVLAVSDYKCVCPLGSKLLPDDTPCTQRAGLVCLTSSCVGPLHWLRDRPRYALLRAGLGRVRRVIACSAWMARALAADGIDADVLELPVAAPGPAYCRVPSVTPSVLYCGRLDREKGVDLLLRAFARVRAAAPAARLRVAGAGPLRPALERRARDLGISDVVHFTGWLDPGAIEHELSQAWALVAPSLWAEPLGLVAPEAIVRGVPVIASASGGFAETVRAGASGLLFPSGDESALTACLLAVVRREVFPEHLVAADVVAATREHHDLGRYVARLREIFAEVRGNR